MVGVAHKNETSPSSGVIRDLRKTLLIAPRKNGSVIFDEPIIVMRDGVWRIKINQISSLSQTRSTLKIGYLEGRGTQALTCRANSRLVTYTQVSFESVRDVELTFQVIPVDPIECESAKIHEACRFFRW